MKFRVFRIKTNHKRFIIFNNSISKTCFYWNSVNKWFAFKIRNHIFGLNAILLKSPILYGMTPFYLKSDHVPLCKTMVR